MGRSAPSRGRSRLPDPRVRLRARPVVALAAICLAACSGAADGTTTSSSAATTTTSIAETTSTSSTEPVLSDLTGDWDNGVLVLMVNDQGEFLVMESGSDDSEEPLMGGFVAREGGDVNFVTGINGECPGQTGVYAASFVDDTLILTLVDDPCGLRAEGFADPWTRAGS